MDALISPCITRRWAIITYVLLFQNQEILFLLSYQVIYMRLFTNKKGCNESSLFLIHDSKTTTLP